MQIRSSPGPRPRRSAPGAGTSVHPAAPDGNPDLAAVHEIDRAEIDPAAEVDHGVGAIVEQPPAALRTRDQNRMQLAGGHDPPDHEGKVFVADAGMQREVVLEKGIVLAIAGPDGDAL